MTQYYLAELDQWFEHLDEYVEALNALNTISPEQERRNIEFARRSAAKLGSTLSAEHRAKIGAASKGKNKGKPRSPEAAAKSSATQKGKPKPAGHGAKVSAAMKGKKLSPEASAKRTEARRRNREAKLAAQE